MNLNDLWIGDRVEIISSGIIGVFNGTAKSGLAIVKIDDNLVELDSKDLKPAPVERKENPVFEQLIPDESKQEKAIEFTGNTIDLHIDKLAPHLLNAPASRILNYQIEACQSFLDASIRRKQGIIHIIHGKGIGVLKSAVLDLLKSNERVNFYVEANQGGALDVWLI